MKKKSNAVRAACSGKQAAIAMNILVLSLSLPVLKCLAAEEQYFAAFQRIAAKNHQDRPILFPLLVDTNNIAVKATNLMLSLENMETHSEISGVRLRMGMEEVVSAWGKPMRAWKWCQGDGPRFNYTGTTVIFDGTNNCVEMILVSDDGLRVLQHNRKPAAEWSVADWVQMLAQPTRRSETKDGWRSSISYENSMETVHFSFGSEGEKLIGLQVRRAKR